MTAPATPHVVKVEYIRDHNPVTMIHLSDGAVLCISDGDIGNGNGYTFAAFASRDAFFHGDYMPIGHAQDDDHYFIPHPVDDGSKADAENVALVAAVRSAAVALAAEITDEMWAEIEGAHLDGEPITTAEAARRAIRKVQR